MTRIPVLLLGALLFAAVACAVEAAAWPTPEGVKGKAFVYKKTPQGELKIYLYYPNGWKETDKRPVIVFFFGGRWNIGTVGQFDRQAKYLAGRGMVTARPAYRVLSRHKTSPVEAVEDAKSAVRWLRANADKLGIDPDRICASGGSAGGHLAASTATVEEVNSAGDGLKISAKPNLLVLYNPVLKMGDGSISPYHHMTRAVPPAIMYYGGKDKLIEHAKAYLKKAGQLKIAAVAYEAPGVGHGFFNRQPWLERTTYLTHQFLAKHGYVKGDPTVELPEGEVDMTKIDEESK